MAQTIGTFEVGLGRTEVEVHIEADRQVVVVIRDEESDDLLFFVLFLLLFHKREDQTTVGMLGVFHLHLFFAPVDDRLPGAALAIGHDEADAVSLLVLLRIEGTGAHHHAQHVVSTIAAFKGVEGWFVLVALVAHLDMAAFRAVGVPHLFLAVGLVFECPLFIIEWRQVETRVAVERVAHDEEFVCRRRTSGNQIVLVNRSAFIDTLGGIHRRGPHFDPDKLPVEVEVVD